MGYVKNRMAGSLALSRSNQVGVILPSMRVGIFPEVLAGITQELEKAGYNPVIGVTDYDLSREEKPGRVAAVLECGRDHRQRLRPYQPDPRNCWKRAGVPVVEIMQLSGDPIRQCVGFDHSAAAPCAGGPSFGAQIPPVRLSGLARHPVRRLGTVRRSPGLPGGARLCAGRANPLRRAARRARRARGPGQAVGGKRGKSMRVIFGNDLMAVGALFFV